MPGGNHDHFPGMPFSYLPMGFRDPAELTGGMITGNGGEPMELIRMHDRLLTPVRLLGRGKGGYSWLVSDETGELLTLKRIHHEPCDYYTFGDKLQSELNDYAKLS